MQRCICATGAVGAHEHYCFSAVQLCPTGLSLVAFRHLENEHSGMDYMAPSFTTFRFDNSVSF